MTFYKGQWWTRGTTIIWVINLQSWIYFQLRRSSNHSNYQTNSMMRAANLEWYYIQIQFPFEIISSSYQWLIHPLTSMPISSNIWITTLINCHSRHGLFPLEVVWSVVDGANEQQIPCQQTWIFMSHPWNPMWRSQVWGGCEIDARRQKFPRNNNWWEVHTSGTLADEVAYTRYYHQQYDTWLKVAGDTWHANLRHLGGKFDHILITHGTNGKKTCGNDDVSMWVGRICGMFSKFVLGVMFVYSFPW